ncbi:OmpA family protein [Euzebyella marina]|uniref:OmpA family protein n=1 Tax=Euzebyella marina TaxID=1761453 RepID=A0A3G2LC06_9FLAO|nr:OmpA family protein [Euzebyella marina]
MFVYSQNLVPNPSFEIYKSCPERLGNLHSDVAHWSAPTSGSTDYFNGCSTAMGTPENFNGAQAANFGVGYAGMYFYAPEDYREYLQVKLTHPLVKGKKYEVSFYVSLAERSDFAIKEFGVLFAKDSLWAKITKELSKRKLYQQANNKYNALEIGYSNFYSDTQDWILVHTQFEAKGSERYLILGNFKSNSRTRLFKTKKNAKQGAYYYVDMISVTPSNVNGNGDLVVKNDINPHQTIQLGKAQVFQNVLFLFNESYLSKEARGELQSVSDYLRENREYIITIRGFTDNQGSKKHNQNLSTRRAKTVARFLTDMGLSKKRIKWYGYGAENPIADNLTEEGRALNRRVEFLIEAPPFDTD